MKSTSLAKKGEPMAKKRVKIPRLELDVVFDTNVLYTGSASDFLRKEVADLIEQNRSLSDPSIRWLIPETVRHEREYQMLYAASQLLPPIERFERLLGHNLAITPEILPQLVRDAVDKHVAQYGLVIRPLDHSAVDWPRLTRDAVLRQPPFKPGDSEKGFRDALILETFAQVVEAAPSTPSRARVALVSGDQLLREACRTRCMHASNVHLLESVDALKGLINTLGSSVDEAFIEAIKDRADQLFFISEDQSTLYYKAGIYDKLQAALSGQKVSLPPGAERYKVEKWGSSGFCLDDR
jgi:hypothetical protein